MIADYLKRGVLAGLVAGVAYGLFIAFVGNPLSEYLHDHGHEHGHGHGHSHSHEAAHAVSETTNALVSVASGVLWAVFLGGMFAIALYFLEPALPGGRAVRASLLASAGFFSVSVTPWLVLPPAAPGAEQLYGIEPRLAIYSGLVVLGAAVSAAAFRTYTRLQSHHSRWLGVLAGAALLLPTIGLLPLVTPTVVTHPDLPADLVSAYQAMVVLSQATLWAVIVATYSWLSQRDAEATSTQQTPNIRPESA